MAHLSNSPSETLEPPGPSRVLSSLFREWELARGREAGTGRF